MLDPLTALQTYYSILSSCNIPTPIHPESAKTLLYYIFNLIDVNTAASIISLPNSNLVSLSECLLYGPMI
jgi:hypothetical protein